MNAYSELYLEDATDNLGEFFDYMVHAALVSLDRSFAWLANSVVGQQFERGNPTLCWRNVRSGIGRAFIA